MEFLTIRLLGIPEIRLGDQALSFRTRKVLALLAYLAVERGLHSRESLMALFWPESPSNSAAASLRVTLSRLRQGLGQAGDVLITEAGNVRFDSDYPFDLDLDWLSTAAHEDTSPDELHSILTVDRGEFLEGFSLPDAPAFDDWISTQRGACLRQLETVYNRLSQYLLSVHDSGVAVEIASRWVRRAPLSEQAYRRLMAAQALNGQRPAALLTYHQLQETLKNELGLEPSRETVLLANNIDQGRVRMERVDASSRVSRIPAMDRQTRLILPLVGRTDEYSQLVESFHQIGGEKAQAVVLIGAAGVGKTRLVNAFKEWALLDTPETEVWQGKAFETGGRLAFQPVVEALRIRLDQVNAPEDLLEDVWLVELSQLIPELRARYPDLPMPLTGNANFVRARLFEAVATLGNALAARRPSILMLDDMQWADADTRDLIHYLARRWSEMKASILLILTVRQEAYAADASLREWLTRLERDTSSTRILLDNLNGAAVEGLVKSLAGDGDDTSTSAFAAWLWAETRGLPFFIEALLQMLIEQDILIPIEGQQPTYDLASALEHVRSVSRVPLPPGVREVIRARLEQHSKEAGALLLAAAVLGQACTFEHMCQIADLQETDALESLEALLDGRLLTERPSDRKPYTLSHDYIREVVYTDSNEARRRVYHRRTLLALEAASVPAAECAYHALAALLDEPAFRYSVAAGSEAFTSYAMQEALSHFNTAREAAQRMRDRGENVDSELLENLYKGRGKILRLNQDDEAAAANYEEMRAEGEMHQSKALELSALIFQSNLHSHPTKVYNPPKARESGQAALALAQELGDRAAQAHALWALQNAEMYSAGDTRQIIAYGQDALVLARELGLKELMAHALKNLCWTFGAQKHLEQARAELAEAQSIWQELGNLQKVAEASRLMLIFHHQAGDHRSILIDAPKLSELGASIGSRLDEVEALAWLSLTCIRQGRFSQALNYINQYGAYAESLGHPHEKYSHQWGRTKFYLAVGALEEAEHWADELSAERKTVPPIFTRATYFTEVALVKIAIGKFDEAQAILDELLANLPLDAPFSYVVIDIAMAYAEINLALGQPENIFEGLDDRMQPYRESGFGYLLADELWLRGRAALALGQYDAARESLLKAKEAADAQEERAILWRILGTMSEVEKECGNADTAEQLREQARTLVDDIAAHAGEMRDVFLGQPTVTQLIGKT